MGNVWAGPLPDVESAGGRRGTRAREAQGEEDTGIMGYGKVTVGGGAEKKKKQKQKRKRTGRRPPMKPEAYGTPADRLGGTLTIHDLEQIVMVLKNRPKRKRDADEGGGRGMGGGAGGAYGTGPPGGGSPTMGRPGPPGSFGRPGGGANGAVGSLLGVGDTFSPPPSFTPGGQGPAVDNALSEVLRTVAASGNDVDFTRLITQLSRAGQWELGLDVFDWLWTQTEIVPTVQTYNAAIACCATAVQRNVGRGGRRVTHLGVE